MSGAYLGEGVEIAPAPLLEVKTIFLLIFSVSKKCMLKLNTFENVHLKCTPGTPGIPLFRFLNTLLVNMNGVVVCRFLRRWRQCLL